MKSSVGFIIAVALMLGACAPQPSSTAQMKADIDRMLDKSDQDVRIPSWMPTLPNATMITLSPQQIRVIKNGVTSQLKDPESARFPNAFVAARGSDGSVVACGRVNAKNSFGGYVGEMPFVGKFSGSSFALLDLATGSTEAMAMDMYCTNLDKDPKETFKGKGIMLREAAARR